ncbi:hypothetical protein B0T25DRAFT_609099 [Lasiosphaeria hispida]|uniref:NACHT domain-containing protein n=1 Tax=Lasiosphaeria hispida TaxID=260671 RepID=A0AAJ0HE64_9PEZI|nr:hypothetical protein B0T25DRAFT_609099 [Lasiosphaeria hispida]
MALDPLSALSVAAVVVQFVDFGRKIVCKSRELYHSINGLTDENLASKTVTLRLQELARDLKAPRTAVLSRQSPRLQQICDECEEISVELLEKLRRLQSITSKTDIDQMAARLARLRMELDTEVLLAVSESLQANPPVERATFDSNMREILDSLSNIKSDTSQLLQQFRDMESSQRERLAKLGMESVKQNSLFRATDQRTREIMEILIRNQAQTITETDNRSKESRSSIEGVLRCCRQTFIQEDGEKRRLRAYMCLLESLRSDKMQHRYEGIPRAHARTFKWIFRDPATHHQPWHSFIHWLESGTGVYWIQGKPASGKSTLMKFLLHHQCTKERLDVWAGDSRLVTASFFFWNSGLEEQRSQTNLFRALLYQMLKSQPELFPKVLTEEWERSSHFASNDLEIPLESWSSLTRLRRAFADFIGLAGPHLKICIFIDGLDEHDGNSEDVAEFIEELSRVSEHAKFCVSSRPWPVFQSIFQDSPGLRVQDLTEDDIRLFVHDQFKMHRSTKRLFQCEPRNAERLVQEITQRAAGVFLWVHLVVKSLKAGVRDGADTASLFLRLRSLPVDLENLYQHILEQIDPEYKEESSRIFQTFRANGNYLDVKTLQRVLMLRDPEAVLRLRIEPMDVASGRCRTESYIQRVYELTVLRLNSRCRGLLEVVDSSEGPESEAYPGCSDEASSTPEDDEDFPFSPPGTPLRYPLPQPIFLSTIAGKGFASITGITLRASLMGRSDVCPYSAESHQYPRSILLRSFR